MAPKVFACCHLWSIGFIAANGTFGGWQRLIMKIRASVHSSDVLSIRRRGGRRGTARRVGGVPFFASNWTEVTRKPDCCVQRFDFSFNSPRADGHAAIRCQGSLEPLIGRNSPLTSGPNLFIYFPFTRHSSRGQQ